MLILPSCCCFADMATASAMLDRLVREILPHLGRATSGRLRGNLAGLPGRGGQGARPLQGFIGMGGEDHARQERRNAGVHAYTVSGKFPDSVLSCR